MGTPFFSCLHAIESVPFFVQNRIGGILSSLKALSKVVIDRSLPSVEGLSDDFASVVRSPNFFGTVFSRCTCLSEMASSDMNSLEHHSCNQTYTLVHHSCGASTSLAVS